VGELRVRHPAVAGQFYEGDEQSLLRQLEACYTGSLGPGQVPALSEDGPRKILGGVAPHAGYMFSGMVAAHLYAKLAADGFPKTFVILGPNHTGRGSGIAISTDDFWTPLGTVKVDQELAQALRKGMVDIDQEAHRFEHSIEVQLPFMQQISKEFQIVPICMAIQDYEASKELGEIIRSEVKDRDVVVIASTDLSHYVTPGTAKVKDHLALEAIEAMDPKKLMDSVRDENISMCGYGPVMATLTACTGGKSKVLKWATSGDIRPMRDVVGYASVAIEK